MPKIIEGHQVPTTILTSFQSVEPVSSTLSKARLAIFEPGENRNGGYISDAVSVQLLDSIAYQPIKGIFDLEAGDFQGHGLDAEGRGYGVVPLECNPTIEKIYDPVSGEHQDYVCVDVFLWTHLYEEARQIVGKRQSMELNAKTVDGEWRFTAEGKRLFHYTNAEFQGFQVLGDEFEPCFGGSHFFEKQEEQNSYNEFIAEIGKHTTKGTNDAESLSQAIKELTALINNFSAGEGKNKEERDMATEDIKKTNVPNDESNPSGGDDKFTKVIEDLNEKLTATEHELNDWKEKFEALETETAELREFQANILKQERDALVAKYTALIGEEKMGELTETHKELPNLAFEKELAFEYVQLQFEAEETEEEEEEEEIDEVEEEEPEIEEEEEETDDEEDGHVFSLKNFTKKNGGGDEVDTLVNQYTKGGNK